MQISSNDWKIVKSHFTVEPSGQWYSVYSDEHRLMTEDHRVRDFFDCNTCGVPVHYEKIILHSKWHETLKQI